MTTASPTLQTSGTGGPVAAGAWQIRGGEISLDRPRILGILNVTPDSFSDGGRYSDPEPALLRAREMVEQGADIIDVGGESTRPGAPSVEPEEELRRVVPVLRLLAAELSVPLSIDTRRAVVAREALEAGARIVNDIAALSDPELAEAVAASGAGVVLMHMRGTPQTMQQHTDYHDVVREVAAELRPALDRARSAGIPDASIVVDPGIGFAKTAEQNLALIARPYLLEELGYPVLLGPSRKAFLGALLGGVPAEERGVATAAACVAGLLRGARLFRVHDVSVVRQSLTVAEAVRRAEAGER